MLSRSSRGHARVEQIYRLGPSTVVVVVVISKKCEADMQEAMEKSYR